MEKNKVLTNAFTWLFIGLLVCFGTSFLGTLNESLFLLIYGSFNGYSYWLWFLAEIIIAIVLTVRIRKMAPTTAKILYLLYTALTGISLTGIFYVYTASSLAIVFLATALTFGIFAFIGKTTKIDLFTRRQCNIY